MNSPIQISVAMCTCNGDRFVAEQLASIARQTLAVDEIIVCDDRSDDQTVATVKTAALQQSLPIQIFENPTRLGVTKNFESAIARCTGDIIFLCDQDDVWHCEKVQALIDCLNDRPDASLVFSDADIVDETLAPTGDRLWKSIWFDRAEQARMNRGDGATVLLRHAVASGSTLAFRSSMRSLLLPIPDFQHSHDIWIALLTACVSRIAPVDRPLIQYRLHRSNQVGMRRYNWIGQFLMARQQVRNNAFGYQAELHQAALDRLVACAAEWYTPENTLALLREKVDHTSRRRDLPKAWRRRLGDITREIKLGGYARYSYGYKSVLQDLFLR